jgi:hypothetical protein
MRETGIGTSIILIATGAVLAFAVNVRSTAIDISAVGAIFIVVGVIGLLLSIVALTEFWSWGTPGYPQPPHGDDVYTHDSDLTPPHEHRRVQTRDVIYEDEQGARVERERRIRRA